MAAQSDSISQSHPKQSFSAGCLIAMGALFLMAGLLAFAVFFAVPMLTLISTRDWQARTCEILTAELDEVRGDDGSTWRAKFSYAYTFRDQRYVGDRDNVFNISSSRSLAEARLAELPVGSETECWVNPQQPAEALLDRSVSWLAVLTGCGFLLIFGGFGAGIIYFGGLQWKSQSSIGPTGTRQLGRVTAIPGVSRAQTYQSTQQETQGSAKREDQADAREAGPQRLKPTQSKFHKLVFLAIMCIIWNGVTWVGVGVWSMDRLFENFWGSLFMGLFLLPFVLIGLALLAGLVSTILSFANPQVAIALSGGAVPLGGELDVAWETLGNVGSVRKLTVAVIGYEWARYVQGTDTRTEQSPFALIEVISSESNEDIRFGRRQIIIPADGMHTFEATNNKIQWVVRVHGAIRWWPDINEEFAFRVTPTSMPTELTEETAHE